MRSISATSAALAATGDISSTTCPAARALADLGGQPRHEAAQRAVTDVAEPLVALLRREVARPQHGAVAVPVVDEAARRAPRASSRPCVRVPRRVEPRGQRRDLVAGLLGEREHRLFHVAEVLVEGRGRRADRACDVDDAQVADAVRLEQLPPSRRAGGGGSARPGARARGRRARPRAPPRYSRARSRRSRARRWRAGTSARTRMPMRASSGSSVGIAAIMRAPSSSRSTIATTNGTRSLNGGTPFWRITVNE